MKKLGDKRGQFYLLAVVVIIALVIGIFSVVNFSSREENIKVQKISEDLQLESQKIMERGAQTSDYPWESFARNFTAYSGNDVTIIYVVGNFSEQKVFRYDSNLNKIEDIENNYDVLNNEFEISYGGINRTFKFYEGQNFYYLIIQDINGEKYVASNE